MRARAPEERRDPISHKLLTNQEFTLPFLRITLTLSIDCLLQQSSFFLTGLHILSPVSPFSNRSGYTAPRITFYLFIFLSFFSFLSDSFRVKQREKGGGGEKGAGEGVKRRFILWFTYTPHVISWVVIITVNS